MTPFRDTLTPRVALPASRPITVRVLVTERADHWELVWPDRRATAPTAAKALAAARKRGRALTAGTGASVVVVEWQPTTVIGRQVVMALQSRGRGGG